MAKYRSREIKEDAQLIVEIERYFSKDGRNLTDVLFLRQHTQKRAILESLDDFVQSCVRGITSSQLRKLYD
ncbi:MAG: hypothetical protein AAF806_26115, partial [Bacteroidota bacterium]